MCAHWGPQFQIGGRVAQLFDTVFSFLFSEPLVTVSLTPLRAGSSRSLLKGPYHERLQVRSYAD
jgi:hypothetical protein